MSKHVLATLILSVAICGVTAHLYVQNQALQERLDALEVQAQRPDDGPEAAAAPTLGADPVPARVARLDDGLKRVVERMAKAETWIRRKATSDEGGALDVESPALDGKIRDVVLDMTGDVRFREKLGLRGAPNLPKKPAFGQLAEVLELDATQEDAFRKDLMTLKEDFLAVISLERDDGLVPLEEIQKIESLPDGDPKKAKVFMKLFTLKVPGTEETYVSRLIDMTAAMKKRTGRYLRDEQHKRFNSLDVDLLGVDME